MVETQKVSLLINDPNGVVVKMRSCPESLVKKAFLEHFVPRFAPNAILLHLGNAYPFKSVTRVADLARFNIRDTHPSSLPDVILIDEKRGWLFLVEAVHSFGPISPERLMALQKLCGSCNQPLVFVTAFLDRNAFRKFAPDIAWDTEVWIADEPDHMIHFNGDRFFGPRN